jgi:hypothetical protein
VFTFSGIGISALPENVDADTKCQSNLLRMCQHLPGPPALTQTELVSVRSAVGELGTGTICSGVACLVSVASHMHFALGYAECDVQASLGRYV